MHRREFINAMFALPASAAILPAVAWAGEPAVPAAGAADEIVARIRRERERRATQPPAAVARDEGYWSCVRAAFRPSPEFVNLEHGYFAMPPLSTQAAYARHAERINAQTSFFMRRQRDPERETVRAALAAAAGVDAGEVALVRNTTEALDTVVSGIDWRRGDEVVTSDQDYGSMLEALEQQVRRIGIRVVSVPLPLDPGDDAEVVTAYERAFSRSTRLVLVTHVINLTGQTLPVRAIADRAHARGIEVMVDGAHSFAHRCFTIPDLGCDYFGTSLHKWLCAPLGAGFLWMRRERIPAVWPLFGDTGRAADDIRKFEHQGTQPEWTALAIPAALEFHAAVGPRLKEERLLFLRDTWMERVRGLPRCVVGSPTSRQRASGIGIVAVRGMEAQAMADRLFDAHRIFTVAIESPAVRGVRVTPHLYTTLADLDRLVDGVRDLCG